MMGAGTKARRHAGTEGEGAGCAGSGGGFTPRRGGDGGVYRAPPTPRHWNDNGRVCLTGASIAGSARAGFEAACVPTIDPADVAHLVRRRLRDDHGPMNTENSILAEPDIVARGGPPAPRRYHPSQVTSRGMPYDSMYDAAAATAQRLQRDLGIDLGWRTGYPRSPRHAVTAMDACERKRLFAGLSDAQVKAVVRPPTYQRRTRAERALSDRATALLRDSARIDQPLAG